MGFFDGLQQLFQNKEVVEDEPRQEIPPKESSVEKPKKSLFVDEHGYKIIPHITLEHVKAHRTGNTMLVTAWATNRSEQRVQIEQFSVLGQKQVYRWELLPQGHTVTLYNGPVASDEYNSHAELVFHLMGNGDQFKNVYHVEFNREADGKFTLEELHDDGPVRDI